MRGVLDRRPAHQRPRHDLRRRVEWKCSSQFSTDVADTAERRLRERCLGANDVFYAVHRTELLRSHFEPVRDCNPRDLFLMEQLVMFLTAIAGKTRQLDTLYIARQQDSPESSGGAHQERFGDWYDRMLLPTWSEDFTRFVDCSAAALSRADGISLDEARRAVMSRTRCRWRRHCSPIWSRSRPCRGRCRWCCRSSAVWSTCRAPAVLGVWRWRATGARRWLSHDFVHGTEFRTRRAREAAREFTPVRTFLTGAGQSSRTSGT